MSLPLPSSFDTNFEVAKVPIPCNVAPFFELHGAWPHIQPVIDTWHNACNCLDTTFVVMIFHPDANLVLNCLIPLLDLLEPADWKSYQFFVPDIADNINFDKLKYYPWDCDTLEVLSPPACSKPKKVKAQGKAKAVTLPPKPTPAVHKACYHQDKSEEEAAQVILGRAQSPGLVSLPQQQKLGLPKHWFVALIKNVLPKALACNNRLQVPSLHPFNAETLLMAVDLPSDFVAVACACGNCWSCQIPSKCDYQGNSINCTPCTNHKLSMCSWRASAEDHATEAEAYGPVHHLSISNLCHKVQECEAWLCQSYLLINKGEWLLQWVKKYGQDIIDIVKTILDQEPSGAFGTIYLDHPELKDTLCTHVSKLVDLNPNPSHNDQLDLQTLTSLLPSSVYRICSYYASILLDDFVSKLVHAFVLLTFFTT
ncbi:unnamed protein product [Cyclocybe aegerita]|uniref:Uncharacterized protein n=1 Tax=Cyclocybe aegerita TaxID=1973307 RepID=A0A8S0WIG2_CYCAE|nr:unnamed protein product [Cyclocybe aegerita]